MIEARAASRSALQRLRAFLRMGLVVGSLAYVAVFLWIAAQRLAHPYELEWMEGSFVDIVARVLSGEPLYAAPDLDYVAYLYTPLYFYLSAAMAWVVGLGFLPLRLVSLVATLGLLVLLHRFVRREGGSHVAGAVAAGLYVATYRAAGAWMDLGRVDALLLFLLAWGGYVVRTRPSAAGRVLAGLVFFLAFATKQSALLVAAPLCGYAVFTSRGLARVLFPLTLALALGASTWLGNLATEDWYGYFVFELPGRHVWNAAQWAVFWSADIGDHVLPGLIVGALGLLAWWRSGARAEPAFHLLFGSALLAAAWASRMHEGAYDNVMLPASLGVALLAGLALARTELSRNAMWGTVASVLLAFQLFQLGYDPRKQVPDELQRRAGDALVEYVASFEGEVFVPYHGYVATLAGKRRAAHAMAILDVIRFEDDAPALALRAELTRHRHFEAVLLNGWDTFDLNFTAGFDTRQGVLPGSAPMQLTGMLTKPMWVLPQGPAGGEDGKE